MAWNNPAKFQKIAWKCPGNVPANFEVPEHVPGTVMEMSGRCPGNVLEKLKEVCFLVMSWKLPGNFRRNSEPFFGFLFGSYGAVKRLSFIGQPYIGTLSRCSAFRPTRRTRSPAARTSDVWPTGAPQWIAVLLGNIVILASGRRGSPAQPSPAHDTITVTIYNVSPAPAQ